MTWKDKLCMFICFHCTFLLINFAYYHLCFGGWTWKVIFTGLSAHTSNLCTTMLEISSILSISVKGIVLGAIIEIPKALLRFYSPINIVTSNGITTNPQ